MLHLKLMLILILSTKTKHLVLLFIFFFLIVYLNICYVVLHRTGNCVALLHPSFSKHILAHTVAVLSFFLFFFVVLTALLQIHTATCTCKNVKCRWFVPLGYCSSAAWRLRGRVRSLSICRYKTLMLSLRTRNDSYSYR